ncbi:MAG: hypothetical protein J3Q66DRAFT_141124 [Benniella sp.]|nr:MAG: hypothetical protein J3Q66DRAFT_141124 [Benniella sp.]
MCFGISAQEVESALSNTKAAFCNSTAVADKPANLEQCVKALKVAVDTLAKIKKDGKRALNRDENIDLKKEIVDVYKDLTQLQRYSGPDKAQKCFRFAEKWRIGVNNIPDPTQPQLRPPVYEGRRSVDSASLSSGGSHSIPDEFYQPKPSSTSGSIGTHDDENSNGSTPGSSEIALNIPCIAESNGDPNDGDLSHPVKPRRQYVKHTGRFADAAPRVLHPSIRGHITVVPVMFEHPANLTKLDRSSPTSFDTNPVFGAASGLTTVHVHDGYHESTSDSREVTSRAGGSDPGDVSGTQGASGVNPYATGTASNPSVDGLIPAQSGGTGSPQSQKGSIHYI